MKLTKSQLKEIINEELGKILNEAVAGGIDEFARSIGVEPLPHRFTDQELVDFTYALLEATSADAPEMKDAPQWDPHANKFGRAIQQHGFHPLTSTTTPDSSGKEVPVGIALEKLIQERHRKSQDPEMREQLNTVRMALLNAVSPTGLAAGYAKSAQGRSAIRKQGYFPEPPRRGPTPRRTRLTLQPPSAGPSGRSALEEIIREELSKFLSEDQSSDDFEAIQQAVAGQNPCVELGNQIRDTAQLLRREQETAKTHQIPTWGSVDPNTDAEIQKLHNTLRDLRQRHKEECAETLPQGGYRPAEEHPVRPQRAGMGSRRTKPQYYQAEGVSKKKQK